MNILLLVTAGLVAFASGCRLGYEPWFAGACYRYGAYYAVSVNQAQSFCEQSGADLLSIHSSEQNNAVAALTKNSSPWLGLTCEGPSGNYSWTDGSPVDFLPPGQEPCYSGHSYRLVSTGAWRAFYPVNNAAYNVVCKHKRRNNLACTDYNQVANSTMCVSLRTDEKLWSEAETECQKEGAHLASLHDDQTGYFVAYAAMGAGFDDGVHIGLQTNASRNEMQWTDGSDTNYTNFDAGFPNDLFGRCSVIETNEFAGKWKSSKCGSNKLPYACGRPAYNPNKPLASATCPSNPYHTSETTIFSPSYPAYPGPISCKYILSAPSGKTAKIVFDDFQLNKGFDKLEIFDQRAGGISIANLTGIVAAGTSFNTSKGELGLVFTAADGLHVRGWQARFIIV